MILPPASDLPPITLFLLLWIGILLIFKNVAILARFIHDLITEASS